MLLTMTDNELLRIKVIQDICDKRLTGVEAAHLLNLSPRQVYRLVKRFIEFGASGLVSLQRGRPGNHRYDENVKLQTLAILHEHYTDFGPTLAHEKQQEFEQQQTRNRSKKAPKRTAQQRAIRQLEAINPVLVHPEQFKPSTRKKP